MTSGYMDESDRIYVNVSVDFDRFGHVKPRAILWPDGRRFEIERVEECHSESTLLMKARLIVYDHYTILVHGQRRELFFRNDLAEPREACIGRWWIKKIARKPAAEEGVSRQAS